MEQNKSILKMLDFNFSKFSFENHKNSGHSKLSIKYEVSVSLNNENKNLAKVIIDTSISNSNESFYLYLQALGIFEIDSHNLSEEEKNYILNKNTVAIMFPFIRSQISLLTTQPGLQPILLQPIDVDSLIFKENEEL